jgi:hypothetical protein
MMIEIIWLAIFPTVLSENKFDFKMTIFPNPGQNSLQMTLAKEHLQSSIVFYNNTGSIVYTDLCENKYKTINTENWANGIYFYQLINTNGEVLNGKWVKN